MGRVREKALGLDQALVNTGYVIVEKNNSEKIINKGVLITSSKSEYLSRLKYIKEEVSALISKYKPTVVYMEDVYTGGRGAWAKLKDVKIILELLCYELNIPVVIMSPLIKRKNSWRKYVGLTVADKQVWCKQSGIKNEHIADAYGIVKGGLAYSTALLCNNETVTIKKKSRAKKRAKKR